MYMPADFGMYISQSHCLHRSMLPVALSIVYVKDGKLYPWSRMDGEFHIDMGSSQMVQSILLNYCGTDTNHHIPTSQNLCFMKYTEFKCDHNILNTKLCRLTVLSSF